MKLSNITLLLMLVGCSSEKQGQKESRHIFKDWAACPSTDDSMTDLQRFAAVSGVRLEGKHMTFNGVVSNVMYDEMADAPVIYLDSPDRDKTGIDLVFGVVPLKLLQKSIRLHKKNEIVISGTLTSYCHTGSLGMVFVDMQIDDIQFESDYWGLR